MLYGESNRLTDSFTVFPSEALRGELTVPGDKVANVHLVLATIACAGTTTEIQNPNYCGDVVEALNVLGDLGLITSTNNDKSTEVRTLQRPAQIDLTPLSHTRSNICLVAPLALQGSEVRFYGTGGCSFTDRATDRHFDLMDELGLVVTEEDGAYTIASSGETSAMTFDCSTAKGVPSVGVTCHALMAGLASNREMTLTNTALEAAPVTLVDYIRCASNRRVVVSGRTIHIPAVREVEYLDSQMLLRPDITTAATYLSALAASSRGEVQLAGILPDDLPPPGAQLNGSSWPYNT